MNAASNGHERATAALLGAKADPCKFCIQGRGLRTFEVQAGTFKCNLVPNTLFYDTYQIPEEKTILFYDEIMVKHYFMENTVSATTGILKIPQSSRLRDTELTQTRR